MSWLGGGVNGLSEVADFELDCQWRRGSPALDDFGVHCALLLQLHCGKTSAQSRYCFGLLVQSGIGLSGLPLELLSGLLVILSCIAA